FHFTDITFAAGVGDTGDGAGCAWADYDLDGHLDLYVANMHGPNRLYRNLGGGVFTDVAPALGVDEPDDDTFQASFFDYDRDGDADLYCANAHGQYCDQLPFHNRLYENVGGTFVDVTEAAGVEACVDSMSIGIGDLDGNGWPDLYITNGPWGNALLLNQGDGTFTQSEVEAGVGSYVMGWGAVFFDADHDGHTDLYVCSGNAPNRLYRHDGAFPCTDVATDLGVDLGGFSYTVATADIDDDGDLDLLVQNADEPLRLFVNHADPARAWAKFDIVGEGAARHAIGAVIDVRCGDVHRVREVVAGCNFKNQNDLVQHVGLADAPVVDEITVVWPGGTTRTMTGHPVGRTWTVYPPDKLGDADGDGQRTLADFIHFIDCMTADGELLPGCEMMDDDGDADVDLDDLDALLERFDEPVADCNGNGIPDPVEIASGAAADDDGDGLIDDCDATPADLDGDGDVDAADLATLLAAWGTADANADLDGSGVVDAPDLAMLLADWT
ncbi:MAG: CRTAC1 family protein, partial [Phycisphaerales bacterium]|nr:CRTAC1 family protein [Phycisphaerales bacterium]